MPPTSFGHSRHWFGRGERTNPLVLLWLGLLMPFDCHHCGWAPKSGVTPSSTSLTSHMHSSSSCLAAIGDIGHHLQMLQAEATAMELVVSEKHFAESEELRRSIFAHKAQIDELHFLSKQRYDKGQPNSSVQAWKEGVPELIVDRRKELMRRLEAEVTCNGSHNLEAIVGDVLSVFAGINTQKNETARLKDDLGTRFIKPVQRALGTRTLQTTDSDGFTCGSAKTSARFCYDVPIDQSLAILLQYDERARRQFRAASRRWAKGDGDSSGSEKIYFDIPDGKAFKSHPMLGTSSPSVNGFKGAIMLYYDGFEVS